MFTQKCFIENNTPELRNKLEEIGIKRACIFFESKYLFTYSFEGEQYYQGINYKPNKMMVTIDCGTNEELFLAIAALRDDSDYMQWFEEDETIEYGVSGFNAPRKKIGEKWYQYSVDNNNISNKIKYNFDTYGHIDGYEQQLHKATVEELIKHFSK
jgi:hypothetical protein